MDVDRQLSLAVSTVIFALRPHPRTRLPVLWVPLVRRIRQPHQGRDFARSEDGFFEVVFFLFTFWQRVIFPNISAYFYRRLGCKLWSWYIWI